MLPPVLVSVINDGISWALLFLGLFYVAHWANGAAGMPKPDKRAVLASVIAAFALSAATLLVQLMLSQLGTRTDAGAPMAFLGQLATSALYLLAIAALLHLGFGMQHSASRKTFILLSTITIIVVIAFAAANTAFVLFRESLDQAWLDRLAQGGVAFIDMLSQPNLEALEAAEGIVSAVATYALTVLAMLAYLPAPSHRPPSMMRPSPPRQ